MGLFDSLFGAKPKSPRDQVLDHPHCPKCTFGVTDKPFKHENKLYCSQACCEGRYGALGADLPAPIPPNRPVGPINGIMQVDVTQTQKTVDVFIVLSEKAKFVVETNRLSDHYIAEDTSGLKKHMQAQNAFYSGSHYDSDRARYDAIVADHEVCYKKRHYVTLSTFLRNPYRIRVSTQLEATDYVRRLETEYLPKLKGLIEAASPNQQTSRSYDF